LRNSCFGSGNLVLVRRGVCGFRPHWADARLADFGVQPSTCAEENAGEEI
jgi:hypothetical protein